MTEDGGEQPMWRLTGSSRTPQRMALFLNANTAKVFRLFFCFVFFCFMTTFTAMAPVSYFVCH
jgi:hypothetical protein